MGGTIHVTSEIDRGSVFWIDVELPLARAAPALSGATAPHILVVDRADDIRDHTIELLQQAGAELRAIETLDTAIAELEQAQQKARPFTLLLLSERLRQRHDGEALLNIVHQAVRHSVRVAVQLAQSSPSRIDRYKTAGAIAAFGYLQRALTLPALLRGDDSASLVRPAAMPAQAPAQRYQARVLLVDDHPVTQIAARHMLESLGCEVVSAHNGSEALKQWQEWETDLILMDTQMPDMDGPEVAERIRDLERLTGKAAVPIIATTANATPEHRAVCLAAGMNGHLPKPLRREALQAVLDEYLYAERQRAYR